MKKVVSERKNHMPKEENRHTDLNIKERSRLTLNGVINVDSFDESYVTLSTSEGRVSVEGQGLKIESLVREGGEIEITGKISGVYYSEQKKKSSFLSRFFG